jgi:hypothetical protein
VREALRLVAGFVRALVIRAPLAPVPPVLLHAPLGVAVVALVARQARAVALVGAFGAPVRLQSRLHLETFVEP